MRLLCILFLLCFFLQLPAQRNDSVYLFSYFKGNGEDGLHIAFSNDGLKWQALNHDSALLRPLVGKEKLMRDPCILPGVDGRYHMVWTASWKDKGIGYAYSQDLVHWSAQQFIPVMDKEGGALNCWAPELMYDRKSKSYMIYWATTIPGRFPATDHSGDNKYNHRLYYTTTSDFRNFADTRLLYDQGFNVIDATIVSDAGGYKMFLKDETKNPPQKNIRTSTSSNAAGPYSAPSAPITDTSYWAEGPTVTRINGKWTVYFDKYTKHAMGAIQSADGKSWRDISNQLQFPQGTRHGTVFMVSRERFNKLKKMLP